MHSCKKCKKEFSRRIVVGGNVHYSGNRHFCFECSPFKAHNTVDLTKSSQYFRYNRRQYHREYMYKRIKAIQKRAVDFAGGQCTICGYDKCIDALEFHHKDVSQKSFGIAQRYSYKWVDLKKEIAKCILLCANCHREVGAGVTQL